MLFMDLGEEADGITTDTLKTSGIESTFSKITNDGKPLLTGQLIPITFNPLWPKLLQCLNNL